MTYPQPREGITGTLRDADDLLSIDEKAIPRRAAMIGLAMCLQSACLVGDPAPRVARMGERIRNPEVGDLVVESTTRGGYIGNGNEMAFGILLAHRTEWAHTDQAWQDELARETEEATRLGLQGYEHEHRPTDDAWYVQYGPQPDDICRWTNCDFITIPTSRDFARIPVGTPDGNAMIFTRDDLVGGLADAGFQLKAQG
jgi:hypothetical protein